MGFSRVVLYNYNKLEEPRVHTNASLKLVFHNFQLALLYMHKAKIKTHTQFFFFFGLKIVALLFGYT